MKKKLHPETEDQELTRLAMSRFISMLLMKAPATDDTVLPNNKKLKDCTKSEVKRFCDQAEKFLELTEMIKADIRKEKSLGSELPRD